MGTDLPGDTGPPAHGAGWVAHHLGIAPATLRTWNRRYGVGATRRSPGGHRRYGPEDLARLVRMCRMVQDGLPVAEAARLCGEQDLWPVRQADAGDLHPLPARRAQELARAAMSLDESTVRRVLTGALRRHGVVASWDQLVVPVLRAIGERYERCGEGVEVEHLLAHHVMAALDTVAGRARPDPGMPSVLLACLEGEWHELALHALAAALAVRRCRSVLLGASVPVPALVAAVRRLDPRAVFVWAQSPATARADDLAALQLGRPPLLIVAGGLGWQEVEMPPGAQRVAALTTALEALTSGPS